MLFTCDITRPQQPIKASPLSYICVLFLIKIILNFTVQKHVPPIQLQEHDKNNMNMAVSVRAWEVRYLRIGSYLVTDYDLRNGK